MAKMNLWNTKNLPMPPINTYKPNDAKIDIKHLSNVFREGKDFFGNEHYIFAEYKILSIIKYRLKQKWRSAKDFKALEKVHKALNNYFETNILKDLKNFMNLIPYRHTDETYLPNKNMLDYILVRLQGIAKLLARIVETCKVTASLLDTRIHIGHLWPIAFIAFSLVSRVFILAKHFTKFVCKLYNRLFPFSQQLKNDGRNWLPVNYVLPPDLLRWINVEWLYIDDDLQIIEPSELPNITQFFDLVDDDDDDIQFGEEYIMIDDDEDIIKEFKKLEDIKDSIQKMRGFDMDEDIGEAIVIDDTFLLENEVQQIDAPSNDQDIKTPGNSTHTEMKEDNVDFGEVIEVSDSRVGKCDQNDIINVDTSLSSLKEYSRGINDIMEISDTSQIITEDEDSFNNNWNKINYLPTSTPLHKVLHTRTNSINENNEVITLLDSPITKRNGVRGKVLQKKKKNIKTEVNKNSSKKGKVPKKDKSMLLRKSSTTDRQNKSNQSLEKCSNNNNNNCTKSIRKKSNSTMSPKTSRNWFIDHTGETVISISDSSTLHENVNKNTKKKKKLKTKKNGTKARENISGSFNKDGTHINASNSDTLSNTLVIDLCGKRKRKKIKRNVDNSYNNSNKTLSTMEDRGKIESSYKHSPNKKRKLEDVAESSDKKVKILRNRVVTKVPKVKLNNKKKEIVESEKSTKCKAYIKLLKFTEK